MTPNWRSLRLWAAALAALALAALLAYAIHKAGLACANPQKRAVFKIVEANGCIEFWVNRYQGLIAALLTGGIAAIALVPLLSQLRIANRQAAAAAAESLRQSTRELDAIQQEVRGARRYARDCSKVMRAAADAVDASQTDPVYGELRGLVEFLMEFKNRQIDLAREHPRDGLTEPRKDVINAAWQLADALTLLATGANGAWPEASPPTFTDLATFRKAHSAAHDRQRDLLAAIELFESKVKAELADIRRQIQRFERAAIGKS